MTSNFEHRSALLKNLRIDSMFMISKEILPKIGMNPMGIRLRVPSVGL
jgi:hypothetical protein